MIDLELERTILGSMCQWNDCLINGMAELKEEHFSDSLHKAIFKIMQNLYNNSRTIDLVTVAQEAKPIINNRSVSWLAIKESYISGAAFSDLVGKLDKLLQTRKLHNIAQDIVEQVKNNADPDQITQAIEQQLTGVIAQGKLDVVTPKEHALRMAETLDKRVNQKTNGGIKTSLAELNRILNGGYEEGQLIIYAAQTGKGKTAFAMNQMRDIAITQKIPALYINTEMAEEQMDVRWLSLLNQIDHYNIATGQIKDEEYKRIVQNLERMHAGGFHSIYVPDLTLNKLQSICRRFTAQKKCKVIVVDYIGRMDTLDPKLQEWQILKTAAKKLKTLAQELKITVIMLAQVNEDEKLEGARAMKNECDLYGYLRPLYPDERDIAELAQFNYALVIEKNRSGPTKKIPLKFQGEILNFRGESNEMATQQQEQKQNISPVTSSGAVRSYGSGNRKRVYSDED